MTRVDSCLHNQAEVEAALFGIAWCSQLGYNRVVLEVDSEFLYKWISQKSTPPLQVAHTINSILVYVAQLKEFKRRHI